jgi:hypothetical protein
MVRRYAHRHGWGDIQFLVGAVWVELADVSFAK